MRSGFTLLEGLLVIGILGLAAGVSVPAYQEYQKRNDVNLAMEHVAQAINRARTLARSGREDAPWGYSVTNGTLFKGPSYAERDPAFDESYPIDDSVQTSGLSEVAFTKIEGEPTSTGTIVLSRNEAATSLTVDDPGTLLVQPDGLIICHRPPGNPDNAHSICIGENAWPAHERHGDTQGACEGDDEDDIGECEDEDEDE